MHLYGQYYMQVKRCRCVLMQEHTGASHIASRVGRDSGMYGQGQNCVRGQYYRHLQKHLYSQRQKQLWRQIYGQYYRHVCIQTCTQYNTRMYGHLYSQCCMQGQGHLQSECCRQVQVCLMQSDISVIDMSGVTKNSSYYRLVQRHLSSQHYWWLQMHLYIQ